jgi:uncharacterized protein (DUF433 family)
LRWPSDHSRAAHPFGDILDMLAGGASRAEILRDYPYLEDADISAALEYAVRTSDHPLIRAG